MVVEVSVLPNYRLHVRFVDGTQGVVDLSRLLASPTARVFTPLRDRVRFVEAHVRDGVVRWPGDLDLAPDAMHDELKGNGLWIVEPFPERSRGLNV